MPTTLFEAKPYDPVRERRRRILILGIAVVVIVVGSVLWWFRYYPEERRVDKFFDALQEQKYEDAYGVWMNDPNWKQHPQQYARYKFGEFYIDWGPGGEWGLVKNHHVDDVAVPKGGGTGVVVVTTVNQRAEKSCIWVEKSDKTLHFSPYKTANCA